MIYFDYAASTPLSKQAKNAMIDVFDSLSGNPSSLHDEGIKARKRLNQARKSIAALINAKPKEIIFTSSGTEANNLAIKGVWTHTKDATYLTTTLEHNSVKKTFSWLDKEGTHVDYIACDTRGYIDLDHLEGLLKKGNVKLVSILYANNEIGTLQPIKEIRALTKRYNSYLHFDMVQVPMHEVIDVTEIDADLLTFSAHKFNGPRGAAFLYIKEGTHCEGVITGGSHEHGLRAGTENLAAIVGMEVALTETFATNQSRDKKVEILAEYFLKRLDDVGIYYRLNGPSLKEARYKSILNIGFKNQDGHTLAFCLNEAKIYVSLGSACDASKIEPSHVLRGINVPEPYLNGSMRFSLDAELTHTDIDQTIKVLKDVIESRKACTE